MDQQEARFAQPYCKKIYKVIEHKESHQKTSAVNRKRAPANAKSLHQSGDNALRMECSLSAKDPFLENCEAYKKRTPEHGESWYEIGACA